MVVPANWPSDLISFITSMLCFDLSRRIATFEAFRTHRYMERIDFDSVLARRISPIFVPKQNKLNCDPTFELEERILESSPLNKHRQRKFRHLNDVVTSSAATLNSKDASIEDAIQELSNSFANYNRFLSTAHRTTLPTLPEQ